jgi:hypothetical protein
MSLSIAHDPRRRGPDRPASKETRDRLGPSAPGLTAEDLAALERLAEEARPRPEDDRSLARMTGLAFLAGAGLWGAAIYGVWNLLT